MIDRRSFLALFAGCAVAGCSRTRRTAERSALDSTLTPMPSDAGFAGIAPEGPSFVEGGAGARGQVKTATWTLAGDGRAIAIVPAWSNVDDRLPMLVALHGRGEANKGPALGVMGWPKDYALLRAIARVCSPPLTAEDFEGFVEDGRLAQTNDSLRQRPFAGFVILCPYSPDVDLRKPPQIREYSEFVMKTLLPRARRELPVLGTPPSTGIDGVSLGGALALRIGLGNADAFGAVGTLQPAIGEDQVAELADLARFARAKNPRLAMRLLTSKEDYFRRAIRSTSVAWRAAGLEHDFEDLPGPHDYPFNRGPGAIEMLLWHERVLARA